MRAYVIIRPVPALRQDAFVAGLSRAGYKVAVCPPPAKVGPKDVLLIWNGHFRFEEPGARRFERAGGTLLVAENAYLAPPGSKWEHFALAQGGHNGAGRWPAGDGSRWEALQKSGVQLQPWREPSASGHIVLCCQRGIGSREMASPAEWESRALAELRKHTGRRIVVRRHPGKPAIHPAVVGEMREVLKGAHACVVWSSSNGIRALVEGVPVIFTAPHWIAADAAGSKLADIERPPMPERAPVFERMAWAQWSAEEIASGEPFLRFAKLKRAA